MVFALAGLSTMTSVPLGFLARDEGFFCGFFGSCLSLSLACGARRLLLGTRLVGLGLFGRRFFGYGFFGRRFCGDCFLDVAFLAVAFLAAAFLGPGLAAVVFLAVFPSAEAAVTASPGSAVPLPSTASEMSSFDCMPSSEFNCAWLAVWLADLADTVDLEFIPGLSP